MAISFDSPLWDLIGEVHDALAEMTDGERVDFLIALSEGYCIHCGSAGSERCECTNDE